MKAFALNELSRVLRESLAQAACCNAEIIRIFNYTIRMRDKHA